MAKSPDHGNPDLPALVSADKVLAATAAWVERGPGVLELSASLEVEGVAIEGLTLRGAARKPMQDRQVVFQLEYHAVGITGGPICRIEWRPLSAHNNRGIGPKELRNIVQTTSHHHRFDLNWDRSQAAILRGEIPIAVPLNPEPENFRALLAVVGKEFRIRRIQSVTVPPWEPSML